MVIHIDDPRVGDIGCAFTITIKEKLEDDSIAVVNISSATVKKIIFEKPGNQDVEFDGEFVTDGSDGKIRYTTVLATDLDTPGIWKMMAYIEMTGGKFHTNEYAFRVYRRLSYDGGGLPEV